MPLHVVATITAKPGSESVVQDALRGLVGPTRGEEGCLSYELYRSAVDPAVFTTIEQWRDRADLDAHMGTPHMAEALGATEGHFAVAPAIHPLEPLDT